MRWLTFNFSNRSTQQIYFQNYAQIKYVDQELYIFYNLSDKKKLFYYLEITSCVEKSRFGNFFSPDLCTWRPVCKRRQSVRFEALQVFVGRPGRRGLFPRSHNNQLLIWENTNSGKRQVTPPNGNKQDSAQIYELPKN